MAWQHEDDYIKDISGEEKLFVKILQVALEDLQNDRYRNKAYNFFLNEDDKQPNSFINICKILGIDENIILNKVRNYYIYGKPMTRAQNLTPKISGDFCNSISELDLQ